MNSRTASSGGVVEPHRAAASHDEPEGGATGFRAREYCLHCRSARPRGPGDACCTSTLMASSSAAGVTSTLTASSSAAGAVVALVSARASSRPPLAEVVDDDAALRSTQASSATPLGDEVLWSFACTKPESCGAAPDEAKGSSSSVMRALDSLTKTIRAVQ